MQGNPTPDWVGLGSANADVVIKFLNALFSLLPQPLLPKWEERSRSIQNPSPNLGRGT
jgi:hypothetical protein